jgi:HEAT repeat protein
LYNKVRHATVPKQRVLEATRGAILAQGSAGLPLLLEQLRSADIALVGIGLRTARELPGRDVTDALASEMDRSSLDRQGPLLLALADRSDSAVLPKLLQVAERGPKPVRASALGLLDRYRDLSCVPVLLNAAVEKDAELSSPARTTLARLGGKEVDADLLARLRLSSGKTREVLIDIAKQRRIAAALPIISRSTEDSDPGVRRAAVQAIGVLGSDQQAGDLVRLLGSTQNQGEREDIEAALLSICGRNGANCLPRVLPLASDNDSAMRIVSLHALASIGGSDALSAVKTATTDRDEAVQDEAVRTLSSWPNTWPDDSGAAEPLLALAKSGKKPSYQAQGMQGYMHYVQETKKLTNDEKLAKVKETLPLLKTPDDTRLAISVLSAIPTAGSLDQLTTFTQDSAVTEEACQALLRIAGDKNQVDVPADARRKALQTVVDKSESDATKKKASTALKQLK